HNVGIQLPVVYRENTIFSAKCTLFTKNTKITLSYLPAAERSSPPEGIHIAPKGALIKNVPTTRGNIKNRDLRYLPRCGARKPLLHGRAGQGRSKIPPGQDRPFRRSGRYAPQGRNLLLMVAAKFSS